MKQSDWYNQSNIPHLRDEVNGVSVKNKQPVQYTVGAPLSNEPTKSAIVNLTGDSVNPKPSWGMTI